MSGAIGGNDLYLEMEVSPQSENRGRVGVCGPRRESQDQKTVVILIQTRAPECGLDSVETMLRAETAIRSREVQWRRRRTSKKTRRRHGGDVGERRGALGCA